MRFKTRLVSSLEKVFCDEELAAADHRCGSALRGEVFAFQLAYWGDGRFEFECEVESELKPRVSLRRVGNVPCELVAPGFDDNVLRKTPGLFPDPLFPCDGKLHAMPLQWRSLWVSVKVPEACEAGKHDIALHLTKSNSANAEENFDFKETFTLEVLPVSLPKQALIHTQWFHADCVASRYQVPCWSERHWELIGKYAANAAEHGINMLLTPLWTPPLDTAVGGERPTTQLLGVSKLGERYDFDFSRLERWLDLCLSVGIEYFEMSHAFTQWGARFTPKIVVREDGVEKKLFGWHVAADAPEYANFLSQLMPPLLRLLRGKGLAGKCYFHVSDEPSPQHIEAYRVAAALVKGLVEDFPMLDALSNVEFYKRGIIRNPVPSVGHIEPFVEAGAKPLWAYYCCGPWEKTTNRFFHFPSARNRVMGMLMFKYDIDGFLHWGFNFWYSQHSVDQNLDPFATTDAGGVFPGGDAFLVYPGPDGPLDSLKYEVFREGLQDMRALRLLEAKLGREAAVKLLEDGLDKSLTMEEYPRGADWLLGRRERINRALVPG